jgi:putative membrane protein
MTAADRGAQQERTTLAWRRTGLALVVGALTVGRLTVDTLGPVVVVPVLLAAAGAAWVVRGALRGRRPTGDTSGGASLSVLSDGRLPAALAVVLALVGVAELASALVALV